MKSGNKLSIVLIIMAIIFTIIGSTFAYWNWATNASQLTEVTFTVTRSYSCSADGGGNITASDVKLAPAACTNSNHAIKRTIRVSTTQDTGKTLYLNMNLKVNSIGSVLANSENFKYALTTSSTSCESGIMAEGTFQGAEANDELPLLTNERYTASTNNDTFYLWIWIDKEETDASIISQSFELTLSGDCAEQEPAKIYAPWGEEVDQYTRINFADMSSASNGQGLYLYQPSEHDTNPIYYYRGNVSNNNVLFGNYCWKIVRTTETGGVKIIYSGTPTSGSCINTTGTASQISASIKFSATASSPSDVGYMQGTRYNNSSRSSASLAESYKYGNSFIYSGSIYTLVDTITSTGNWANDYNTLNNNHYTCFDTSGTCTDLYYVFFTDTSNAYYITLTGGKSVEDAIDEMITSSSNTTSSTIKSFIDSWYTTNLASYENILEDTVWCNDREISALNGWDPDGGDTTEFLNFKPYERADKLRYPRLTCNRIIDSFTKSSANGNGSLDNPIGLLTIDEAMLAGGKHIDFNDTFYLYNGKNYWLMSPLYFYNLYALGSFVESFGSLTEDFVRYTKGVRPAISLKPGLTWTGDGTANNPYQVSMNLNSNMSMSLDKSGYEVDDPIVVTANLPSDATGTVTITVGENTYNASIVNGVATYTITDRILSGERTIAVAYSGDSSYGSSNTSETVTVSKISCSINAKSKDYLSRPSDVVITVTVPGDAVGTVTALIDEGEFGEYTASINQGKAKVIIPEGSLPGGRYSADITYNGDDKYLPAYYRISRFTYSPREDVY